MRRVEVDRVVVRLSGVDAATARAAVVGLGPQTRRLVEQLNRGGSRAGAEASGHLTAGAGPDAVRNAIARAVATEVASRAAGPARHGGHDTEGRR